MSNKNKELFFLELEQLRTENQRFQQSIAELQSNLKILEKGEQTYKSLFAMFRLMADNTPDLFWATDMECKFLFTNKAICEKLLNAKDTQERLVKTDLSFAIKQNIKNTTFSTFFASFLPQQHLTIYNDCTTLNN